MVINSFVKWLLEQGHHVVQTESTCWYDIGPRIYQAFPYHQLVNPSRAELLQLFRNEKAIGLRYSTLVSEKYGKLSYHVINTNKDYSLDHLSKKARYDVRKGLKYASVEPITLARLADEGWLLRSETLGRQGRTGAESQTWWQLLCHSAANLPGFEAWGVIHEGKLVSALLAITIKIVLVFYNSKV